jgi:CRISPR-associated exonuclease Cas4
MLNQFAYCQRRFYYVHVLGEMDENALVLEGSLLHERAHEAGVSMVAGERRYRRLYLWSEELRLSGFCDLVEERGGTLIPVEFKHGRMGRWLNDHLQLCAQALCLEERTGTAVPFGEIFYFGSRRRQRVPMTEELREHTKAAIAAARRLASSPLIPAPIDHPAKCRDCSLHPICLPREVLRLNQGLRR